jgi:hypothetical protein
LAEGQTSSLALALPLRSPFLPSETTFKRHLYDLLGGHILLHCWCPDDLRQEIHHGRYGLLDIGRQASLASVRVLIALRPRYGLKYMIQQGPYLTSLPRCTVTYSGLPPGFPLMSTTLSCLAQYDTVLLFHLPLPRLRLLACHSPLAVAPAPRLVSMPPGRPFRKVAGIQCSPLMFTSGSCRSYLLTPYLDEHGTLSPRSSPTAVAGSDRRPQTVQSATATQRPAAWSTSVSLVPEPAIRT